MPGARHVLLFAWLAGIVALTAEPALADGVVPSTGIALGVVYSTLGFGLVRVQTGSFSYSNSGTADGVALAGTAPLSNVATVLAIMVQAMTASASGIGTRLTTTTTATLTASDAHDVPPPGRKRTRRVASGSL